MDLGWEKKNDYITFFSVIKLWFSGKVEKFWNITANQILKKFSCKKVTAYD